MIIERDQNPKNLLTDIDHLFDRSAAKIINIQNTWNPDKGTPVFTVKGKYTTRGCTEWTQGFLYGSASLFCKIVRAILAMK